MSRLAAIFILLFGLNASALPPQAFSDLMLLSDEAAAATPAWGLTIVSTSNGYWSTLSIVNGNPLTVDWGDGSVSNVSGTMSCQHTYGASGTFDVKISGSAGGIKFYSTRGFTWKSPVTAMTNITGLTNCYQMFRDCSGITNLPANLFSGIDVSGVKTLQECFYGASALVSPPIINGMTNCTTMATAFRDCAVMATAPDLTGMIALTSLAAAFHSCNAMTNFPPGLGGLTNLTTINSAFYNDRAIKTSPDLSALTKLVSIASAFRTCRGITNLPTFPSGLASLTECAYAFYTCSNCTFSAPVWWNSTGGVDTANFPSLVFYDNTYKSATILSNYGAIPASWGGTNNAYPLW